MGNNEISPEKRENNIHIWTHVYSVCVLEEFKCNNSMKKITQEKTVEFLFFYELFRDDFTSSGRLALESPCS